MSFPDMWARKLSNGVPKDLYFVTPRYQSQPRSRSNSHIGKGTSFHSCLSEITFCCAGTSGPVPENRQVDGAEGGGEYNTCLGTVYFERVWAAEVDHDWRDSGNDKNEVIVGSAPIREKIYKFHTHHGHFFRETNCIRHCW